jgi:branched-chain amino acid aminotransferase
VTVVYLNGKLLERAEASVSVFDHGLLTGDGVFESVVIRNGRPFGLERHLARLEASAQRLGLEPPPREELEHAVHSVNDQAGLGTGKLRITITGGYGPLGSARGSASPTVIVACEELGPVPEHATVVVAPWPRNERGALAGAKTISYAENVVALAYAAQKGATEAIFLNLAGNLCEGTGSNIFVGIDGELVTPPLSSGCLAGVTRGFLLEVTAALERDVPGGELERVAEAFLTSTTRGVQPIASIDGRPLPHYPGPLTTAAGAAFARLVENSKI